MAKTLRCECGYVVTGQTDDEFIANAQAHISDAHPDLVGKVKAEDILAMAQEL